MNLYIKFSTKTDLKLIISQMKYVKFESIQNQFTWFVCGNTTM